MSGEFVLLEHQLSHCSVLDCHSHGLEYGDPTDRLRFHSQDDLPDDSSDLIKDPSQFSPGALPVVRVQLTAVVDVLGQFRVVVATCSNG